MKAGPHVRCRTNVAAAVLAAAGVLLAGCSYSQSTEQVVHRSQVEQQVKQHVDKQLAAKGDEPLDDVSCPHDLDGKAGKKERCSVEWGRKRFGTTVRVKSVEGSHVKFSIQVDERPMR